MVRNKSFTLIELLVVIAIIGLLAAVVLVSTGGIQQKAKITKALEFSQSVQRSLGAYAVGIWSFDDQTNPTKDGSGYGNNGTVNGATFSSDTPHAAIDRGTGKYALSFNGVNGYVSIPDNSTLSMGNGNFTIEVWMKYVAVPTVDKTFLSKFAANGAYSNYEMYFGDFGANVGARWTVGANDWRTLNSNFAPSASTWYHFVLIHDSGTMRWYTNGSQTNSGSSGGTISTAAANVILGARMSSAGYSNVVIDEVRIYEKALTLGEIKKHYAEGLERHKDLATK